MTDCTNGLAIQRQVQTASCQPFPDAVPQTVRHKTRHLSVAPPPDLETEYISGHHETLQVVLTLADALSSASAYAYADI